jgi:hypothetical protein
MTLFESRRQCKELTHCRPWSPNAQQDREKIGYGHVPLTHIAAAALAATCLATPWAGEAVVAEPRSARAASAVGAPLAWSACCDRPPWHAAAGPSPRRLYRWRAVAYVNRPYVQSCWAGRVRFVREYGEHMAAHHSEKFGRRR